MSLDALGGTTLEKIKVGMADVQRVSPFVDVYDTYKHYGFMKSLIACVLLSVNIGPAATTLSQV